MKYLEVGKIVSTHGIKGEIKVKSVTNFPEERYSIGNILYVKNQDKMEKIEINSYRTHKGLDLITINNIKDINDVLKYVGLTIYVDEDSLSKLEEDEFYVDELIGLDVLLENNEKIGTIIDVREVPQGDLIVIKKNDGKESLIPFVNEFFREINLEDNFVILTPIEGLL